MTQSDGTDDLFVLEDGVDTPKGKFVEKGIKGITGGIEAFYPASLKNDDGYVWPAVQTNSQVAPMYAKQTISGIGAETVSFSSLGAMLQIVFNSVTPDITVTSVTIKDADKPMSGRFTVETDQDGGALAVIDDDAENVGITLDLGAGVEMGKSAKYFYMTILAGQYSNLTLTFTASNGMVCEMKSSTFPSVERNTVGRLTLSGEFKNVVRFDLNGKGTAETDYKLLVSGMLVTGREDKGETGNSIFLPAGGHYYSDEHKDSATYYASPDVTGGKTHIYLWFKDGAVMRSNGSSYDAALVRPVAVPGY